MMKEDQTKTNTPSGTTPTGRKFLLLVFFTMFCVGMFVTSLFTLLIGTDTRFKILFGSCVQDILVFLMPACIIGWLACRRPTQWLMLSKMPKTCGLALIAAVFVTSIPTLNYIVVLNESLSLPSWLSELEKWMRNMEDMAAATTEIILGDTSMSGLVSGILIVGLLGPLAEEVFFRGTLQKLLYGPTPWKAVWWSAFIFSFLHLQMYGFVPRFLLGLWFGYLYLWSGNLWLPIVAHMLNNSATIISNWFTERGIIDSEYISLGSDGTVMPIIISIVFTTVLILYTRKRIHGSTLDA